MSRLGYWTTFLGLFVLLQWVALERRKAGPP